MPSTRCAMVRTISPSPNGSSFVSAIASLYHSA